MKRRKFLGTAGLASTSLLVPSFLSCSSQREIISSSQTGKKLIVVQLSGGNDGLNTVVPFQNDLYYQYRSKIALPKNKLIKIDGDTGLNPALSSIEGIFKNGEMSIINSVGYPNPNRSHFRSMDIWHMANENYLQTGWIGRYLDSSCNSCNSHHAIEMDDTLSLALKGIHRKGFSVNNDINNLIKLSQNDLLNVISENDSANEKNVSYLYKTLIDTQSSANYIHEKSVAYRSKISYPKHAFGKDLKQIAELIIAGSDTKIYYVSLSGFDTHNNQNVRQHRLLKIYGDAVKALVMDLKRNGLFDETLILTFSEFGRRVKENGSKGTDHGTANNVFVIGGRLKKAGLYNPLDDLTDLHNDDLKYKIDFRRIYASVLEDWLGVNSKKVLLDNFKKLDLF